MTSVEMGFPSCRTQDTKGMGSAEATHSITTLWPETTVVFSGAATMTTSCPLVDARDPLRATLSTASWLKRWRTELVATQR